MKTLRYTIVLVGLILASCQDLLETVPNDRISTDIFWKTEKDATLGANAVYTHMIENASHYVSWDGMTDIGYTHLPQSPESFILQGQFDALNSRVYSDYVSLYSGVRAANVFLLNVDNVQTTNTALINRLKGEVRTLRAYFYSRLAMLFGDVPLFTADLNLAESRAITRTPVAQVWDFVSTEFQEAAALLPNTQTEKGRVTKGTALALKARAMLHAGRYQAAVDAASAVMGLNVYKLYPTYKTLFTTAAENNSEIIFDVQYIKSTQSNDMFSVLAQQSLSSKSLYVPTKQMVDAYEMKNGLAITDPASGFNPNNPYANRDPRLGYSVFLPGDMLPNNKVFNPNPNSTTGDAVGSTFTVSPTGFNLEKYVNAEDLTTPTNTGINLILMRYAEVLLIYAEAKIELNAIDASVYDAINQIRQRPDVLMPAITTGKTQEQLRAIVRHERVVELAFEGQRFFDIRRWRIAENVMPGKVYGMTYVDGGTLKTVEVTGWQNYWSNKNYLWPIPQVERDLNDNLGQNPEW
ncbi:MAG TPA: RagB/SusD family nutrient uptake outer membrane protein [Cyclobacteriaceae bacterium]|nr:RagB/SusD family nutrient uptake outer membrane protein [Cyclobacteriaceae bacterium]